MAWHRTGGKPLPATDADPLDWCTYASSDLVVLSFYPRRSKLHVNAIQFTTNFSRAATDLTSGNDPDSNVGRSNVGPTSVLSYQRWTNVSPVYIAVWAALLSWLPPFHQWKQCLFLKLIRCYFLSQGVGYHAPSHTVGPSWHHPPGSVTGPGPGDWVWSWKGKYNTVTDSMFAPSQWETALLCNDVSQWLGANLELALNT